MSPGEADLRAAYSISSDEDLTPSEVRLLRLVSRLETRIHSLEITVSYLGDRVSEFERKAERETANRLLW